ncbi:hypothetical protein ACFC8N_42730 [Streptomyces sp. NPDC055966]|uniref:hypothetical protein n=1 Tax=Streptomyces sp. NPDC055966 TaxID=3345669 RepID=UPI0035DAB24D
MSLLAWLKSRRAPQPSNRHTDMWKGKPLPERNRAFTQLHYRLYDRRTGNLLGYGSTNSLTNIGADILRTQQNHPNAQVYAVEYDGPAYTD